MCEHISHSQTRCCSNYKENIEIHISASLKPKFRFRWKHKSYFHAARFGSKRDMIDPSTLSITEPPRQESMKTNKKTNPTRHRRRWRARPTSENQTRLGSEKYWNENIVYYDMFLLLILIFMICNLSFSRLISDALLLRNGHVCRAWLAFVSAVTRRPSVGIGGDTERLMLDDCPFWGDKLVVRAVDEI